MGQGPKADRRTGPIKPPPMPADYASGQRKRELEAARARPHVHVTQPTPKPHNGDGFLTGVIVGELLG